MLPLPDLDPKNLKKGWVKRNRIRNTQQRDIRSDNGGHMVDQTIWSDIWRLLLHKVQEVLTNFYSILGQVVISGVRPAGYPVFEIKNLKMGNLYPSFQISPFSYFIPTFFHFFSPFFCKDFSFKIPLLIILNISRHFWNMNPVLKGCLYW